MPYLLNGRSIVLALIALALLSTSAFALPGPGPHPPCPEGPPPGLEEIHHNEPLLLELLSLTEGQRQQVEKLFAENQQAMAQNRKQLDTIHEQLRTQLEADILDETVVRSLLQREAVIKAEEMISFHQQDKELALILTEEQKKKADLLRDLLPREGGPRPPKPSAAR